MKRCLLTLVFCLLATASLVAQDMRVADVLVEGKDWELVAEGFKFTEGPAVDGEGNLYFTDIPNNRIHRLAADGKASIFAENSGAANGLMFGPDGRLYACQNAKRRIAAYDRDGKETVFAEGLESNDLVILPSGAMYVTDPGNKQVWHVSPQGEKRVVDVGIGAPNGVILWPDQGTLVVSDTRGPHLWAFRVEADGSLSHKQPYYTMQLPRLEVESGADGMTVDSAGRLYVTTKVGLQMFDPTGRLGGTILKPQNAWLSNVVFGGEKLDLLFVTCGDKVYRRATKAAGVRYFPPR